MKYSIEILEVGKAPKIFHVYDASGLKRPARFETGDDALECMRVIDLLRTDTAYQRCRVIEASFPCLSA